MEKWFGAIKKEVSSWWDAGSGDGGGLAMNDSVIACFKVLKSVFQHLTAKGKNLRSLNNQELSELFVPYALAASRYLASLSKEERQIFRRERGGQGKLKE